MEKNITTGKNFTFLIPVKIDSEDRKRNIKASINYLKFHLPECKIFIYESDFSKKLDNEIVNKADLYIFEFNDDSVLYRTRYLNELAYFANTPIISTYDCDVLLEPKVFDEIENAIFSENQDLVYPYGLGFYQYKVYCQGDEDFMNVRSFSNKSCDISCYGHAQFFKRQSYFNGYMFNENFISYGPEDKELYTRYVKLGYNVSRINRYVYHLEHERTFNSNNSNPYFIKNLELFDNEDKLTSLELRQYMDNQQYYKKYL